MREITFSAFNNPNVWYEPDTGAIHFASEEDAKRCAELLTKIQSELLAARPEGREQEVLRVTEVVGQDGTHVAAPCAIDGCKYGELERDAARYRWLRDSKHNALHLERNGDHASSYRTAKEWIEEDAPEWFKDEPAEAVAAMKATNTIWALQVYPDTPIGFVHLSRATLDEVIDIAMADDGFLPSSPQEGSTNK